MKEHRSEREGTEWGKGLSGDTSIQYVNKGSGRTFTFAFAEDLV